MNRTHRGLSVALLLVFFAPIQLFAKGPLSSQNVAACVPDFGTVSCATELRECRADLLSCEELTDSQAETISLLEEEIAGLEEDVMSLEEDVMSLEDEVASLNQEISDLNDQIGSKDQEIADKDALIEQQSTQIADLTAQLDLLDSALPENLGPVNFQQFKRLYNLSKKIGTRTQPLNGRKRYRRAVRRTLKKFRDKQYIEHLNLLETLSQSGFQVELQK